MASQKTQRLCSVIASDAKQSRGRKQGLDCFVASLLAMTNYFTSNRSTPFQSAGGGTIWKAQIRSS
jgi:hypothetical protein